MTPEEFKSKWILKEGKLSPIDLERLVPFKLKESTIAFLTQAGLPEDAPPFLSFSTNTNNQYNSISKLNEQYDFLDEEYSRYIVIGSANDGDVIAIDSSNNDAIRWLDHEDYFESHYFNISIEDFFSFLLLYKEFIATINTENGEDAYINFDFTDKQLDLLKQKMHQIDPRTLTEYGFWKLTLETDLLNREYFSRNQ